MDNRRSSSFRSLGSLNNQWVQSLREPDKKAAVKEKKPKPSTTKTPAPSPHLRAGHLHLPQLSPPPQARLRSRAPTVTTPVAEHSISIASPRALTLDEKLAIGELVEIKIDSPPPVAVPYLSPSTALLKKARKLHFDMSPVIPAPAERLGIAWHYAIFSSPAAPPPRSQHPVIAPLANEELVLESGRRTFFTKEPPTPRGPTTAWSTPPVFGPTPRKA